MVHVVGLDDLAFFFSSNLNDSMIPYQSLKQILQTNILETETYMVCPRVREEDILEISV